MTHPEHAQKPTHSRGEAELAAIISDAEITRVHGRANFGALSPREVVNDGVRKIAVGYHCGHTQFCILREHGLITTLRAMSSDANLTKKGKKYARRLMSDALFRPAHREAHVQLSGNPGQLKSAQPETDGGGEAVTCQSCGGEIQGWTCQGCGATFRENDAGVLVRATPEGQTEGSVEAEAIKHLRAMSHVAPRSFEVEAAFDFLASCDAAILRARLDAEGKGGEA